MGAGPSDLRGRVARAVLRLAFDAEECDGIVRDVEELVAHRSGAVREVAFWVTLCSYPLAEWGERLRSGVVDRSERGRMRAMPPVRALREDLGFALRGLLRRRAFTATTVTILAIGLGAVISMGSVVQGVLLDPLPMEEPDRLVSLWMLDEDGRRSRMTPGNLRDVAALGEVFQSVTGFQQSVATLADPGGGPTMVLRGGEVTPEYFGVLGAAPLHGRDFASADMDPATESVVLLAHHVWQQVFGGDPGIVGRSIELGSERSRVIGVVPTGLHPTVAGVSGTLPFIDEGDDFFRVIRFAGDYWDLRQPHLLGGIARLRDGVSPERARAALATLSDRLSAEFAPNRGESIIMTPLKEEIVGDSRLALLTLFLAVALVLLIAAVNVGSLFLLRAEDRLRETGLLRALGAPSRRVTRQRVLEAAMVCLAATGAGVALATWVVGATREIIPYSVPRLESVGVEPTALAVATVVALGLSLLFGALPDRLHRGSGPSVGTRRTTSSRRRTRIDSALIGAQAGIAVVVVVWALLLSRSLLELSNVDPGFASPESWVFELRGAYGSTEEILDAVRRVPGVETAALTLDHPLERNWEDGYAVVDGPAGDEPSRATIRPFGEGYLGTVGVDLVEGRVPDALDFAGDVRMALVNEAFRRRHAGGGPLLGRRVRVPSADRRLGEGQSVYEIVGVVRDVRFLGPQTPSEPAIYIPLTHFAVTGRTLVVRPELPDAPQLEAIRSAVVETAPDAAIDDAVTLGDLLDRALARPRFHATLLSLMSVAVLILCSLGAYGLVSRTVVTRKREIGIRTALGATDSTITRAVVGRAMTPLVVGAAAGAGASLVGSRLLRSLLYEVSPSDPVSVLGAPLLLIVIGGAASLLPARRVLSLDPAESLRAE